MVARYEGALMKAVQGHYGINNHFRQQHVLFSNGDFWDMMLTKSRFVTLLACRCFLRNETLNLFLGFCSNKRWKCWEYELSSAPIVLMNSYPFLQQMCLGSPFSKVMCSPIQYASLWKAFQLEKKGREIFCSLLSWISLRTIYHQHTNSDNLAPK